MWQAFADAITGVLCKEPETCRHLLLEALVLGVMATIHWDPDSAECRQAKEAFERYFATALASAPAAESGQVIKVETVPIEKVEAEILGGGDDDDRDQDAEDDVVDIDDDDEGIQAELDELIKQLDYIENHPEIAAVLIRLRRKGEILCPGS
jgi:hypothetical protein